MSIAVPFRILLPLLLLLVSVLPAGAQPVRLVKNLYPDDGYSRRDIFSFPEYQFLAVGEKVFFVTDNDIGVTDGTAAGTRLLYHDPGTCSRPHLLGNARNLVLWTGCSTDEKVVLWRSDGTVAGTYQLTSLSQVRIEFYPPSPGSLPDDPTYASAGGFFYFTGCDESQCSLWRTDGTRQGTRAVVRGGRPAAGTGGRLFFVGSDNDFNSVLAVTNGTAAGTVHLKSFDRYPPRRLTFAGGKLFFLGGDEEEELWVSDGTVAGTRSVSRFLPAEPFDETNWLKAIGNRVYFLADDSVHGVELWRSDGTAAGTVRVSEIAYDTPFSETMRPSHVEEAAGGRVVFLATDGLESYKLWATSGTPESTALLKDACSLECEDIDHGFDSTVDLARTAAGRVIFKRYGEGFKSEAWSTDGTPTGTVQLSKDIVGKPFSLQGRTFFGTSNQLWLSDGTLAGTKAFGDLPPQTFFSSVHLVMAGGKVVFLARNELYGLDLWASDGRPGGTELLIDFDPQDRKGSSPSGLTELGGQLYFSATTPGPTPGSPFNGIRTLWRSGGSAETTLPLPGAPTTPAPGCNTQPQLNLFRVGSKLFFPGPGSQCDTTTLWSTDGTPEGTRPLGINPLEKVVFQGQIFFLESFSGPAALWKNDGTPGGSVKVFDLPAGIQRPSYLTPVGSELYFLASDAEGTQQVWRTNGTLAGTRQVTSFTEDDEIRISPQFVRAGAFVFFPAGPDFRGPVTLWRTDGTPGGTIQLTEVGGYYDPPVDLTAFKGNLFFFHDGDLLRSDGTPGGLVHLRSFPGDSYFRVEHQPVVFGDHLFFAAYDPVYGTEIWKTDGTAAGTTLVRDIFPGESSSWPQLFTLAGNKLFFQANDGAHGYELWQSDGTTAGTRLVQDLNPGFASSYPSMAPVGNRLFISADDGSIGRELWVLPLGGPTGPCQPSPTALCLSGGRFRVEAQWKTLPSGQTGAARAVSLSPDAGYFWFSDPAKVDTLVKVLDGRGSNGHHWVFYGSLSNVEYSLTVTDTQTGLTRRYFNHQGYLASVGDRNAFGPQGATAVKDLAAPAGAVPFLVSERFEPMAAARCVPSAARLCLNNGRFAVEAKWKIAGRQGAGKAVRINGDTGYFWFNQASNVETVVRIEDGRQSNGRFWFLSGSLSDAEYEITVTDTVTRKVKTYKNPSGRFASVRDTAAF